MSFILKNTELQVEIRQGDGFYASSRFDHSSIVTAVLFRGRFPFLSREMADNTLPDRRGHGLACEFGIRTPVGYADCPRGGLFPKIGVGWVEREDDGPYDFYRHAKRFFPLAITAEYSAGSSNSAGSTGSVTFRADSSAPAGSAGLSAESLEASGFRWTEERRWTLEGNALINRVTLTNLGSRPIETSEYAHNFLAPGGAPTGPDWMLETGFPLPDRPEAWGDTACLSPTAGETTVLSFARAPADQFGSGSSTARFVPDPERIRPEWKLTDRSTGLWVSEELRTDENGPFGFEFWGHRHTFSPELFTFPEIPPGESRSWERRYTFGRD